MQNLKIRSRGSSVSFLQELLFKVGYDIPITDYFGSITESAVNDFQSKNSLVIDGEVSLKTWTVFLEETKPAHILRDKFLEENDLIDFSKKNGVELASIKAVNKVESSGKGLFVDGIPKILFKGHIFWRRLKGRGIDTASWGSYQIMGFHELKLGYPTVQDFVNESNQLDALERYIATFTSLTHLKNKDRPKFAKCHNGPGYAKNRYDIKLEMAYRKYLT
jgi:peptidoglycan hydrolase-like protein with peptidoglycan-binding domain